MKATVVSPSSFPILNAFITFFELPLVVIPIKISPLSASASICLSNTDSYVKSFDIAVSIDVFVVSAIEPSAALFM